MKKTLLLTAAILLILSAGCAKQAAGDPEVTQNATLKAVSEEQAEITLILEQEASASAAIEQTADTTKSGADQPSPSEAETTAAKETTRPAGKVVETTKPDETEKSSETANPSETINGSGSGTTTPGESQQTDLVSESKIGSATKTTVSSAQNETLPTADSDKDRFELPAIPLN